MERDNKGLSRLYSLDIFKIRNEKIIKDGYINGLYGGKMCIRDRDKTATLLTDARARYVAWSRCV